MDAAVSAFIRSILAATANLRGAHLGADQSGSDRYRVHTKLFLQAFVNER